MSLTFVNHNGDPITDSRMAAMRAQGMELERQRRLAAKSDSVSMLKDWRVSSMKPGMLDEGKQAYGRRSVGCLKKFSSNAFYLFLEMSAHCVNHSKFEPV